MNREFDITIEDVFKKLENQNGKCFYCNITISTNKSNENERELNQISVDRKDSIIGHTKNNCVISCLFCNYAKSASTVDNYKSYINALKYNTMDNNFLIEQNAQWASILNRFVAISCRNEKIECEFTTEIIKQLYEKQNGKDYFTDLLMIPSAKKFFPFQPSLDRLDNNKPHTLDNCVLVCYAGNVGRNNASTEKYLEHIKKIRDSCV